MSKPFLPGKKQYTLTPESFEHLLSALASDRATAAEKYEHIRQALITFFTFRGTADPYELADETINRVATRLFSGTIIFASQPASYFLGVARNIWREVLVRPHKLEELDAQINPPDLATFSPEDTLLAAESEQAREKRFACLEKCLQALPAKDRIIILTYYRDQGSLKIETRQQLATQFGISPKTLRNKTHLLRAKLLECIKNCDC